jgi:hypothetical protein
MARSKHGKPGGCYGVFTPHWLAPSPGGCNGRQRLPDPVDHPRSTFTG